MTSQIELVGADVAAATAEIDRLIAMLSSAGADEAADAAEQARKAREWVKVTNGAADLSAAALRLECSALRRLAQCGEDALKAVPPARRSAGRWLAGMTGEQFAECMACIKAWDTPVAMHRRVIERNRVEAEAASGRRIGQGIPRTPVSTTPSIDEVRAAAQTIVEHLQASNQFSIAEAADKVAEDLDLTSGGYVDWLTASTLRAAVREAVAHADWPDEDPDVPAFVTYQEDEIGWVRIPWSQASITQLEFMVELRRKQVRELQAALEPLDDLLTVLRAAHAVHPDLLGCLALYKTVPDDEPEER